jgi:hypothetical protein
MSFALWFVRSPKKLNVHLCQKVPFVLACFKPRLRLGQKILHFLALIRKVLLSRACSSIVKNRSPL